MGTVVTGTYGRIKDSATGQVVGEITNWSHQASAATRSYQSNITNGVRKRAVGGKDYTGEFDVLLGTGSGERRKFEEGDSFTAIFSVDSAYAHTIVQPIVIESVDNNVDVDGDGLVGGRVRWGGNGAPSYTGGFAVNQDITSSS